MADPTSAIPSSGHRSKLALLGPFEFRQGDGLPLRLPKKAQALLAYLAMQKGRMVPREQLSTMLWGNSGTEQARQSLRQCLAVLRSTLGADASEAIVADVGSVTLMTSDRWWVDVAAFEAALQSKSLADLEHASSLYRDEFLNCLQIPVQAFSDWLSVERQRLSALRIEVLERVANALANEGNLDGAISTARQIAGLDPLGEEGHRLVMRLLAAAGNRSAALKQYERCVQILREELDIPPDAETEDLAAAIRAGKPMPPNMTTTHTPARSPSNTEHAPASVVRVGLSLPDKPSIVVLPFANLSGDLTQNYFVDGLVEDITVALGREAWLFVIASPSAFAFNDRSADPREVAVKLGVRYVLRGSVRKGGNRVRIVVQLMDAASGAQIWSDRFEDDLDNVFAMNERLMAQVAALIAPAVRSVEIERARRKPTGSLSAFDCYLQALPRFRTSLAENQAALGMLEKAVALDPTYGAAYGLAARCFQFQKLMGWVRPDDPRLNEGVRLAHLATELGSNDSEALWMTGLALVQLAGEIDHGQALIDRSLSLNPNSANAWTSSALVRTYVGETTVAIEQFHISQRLNPLDQSHHVHWNIVGMAYFAAGRYDEADDAAEKTLRARPTYPGGLRLKVATCGILGRTEEGLGFLQRLLAVHPDYSIAWLRAFWAPLMERSPEALINYIEGSRRVGVPEEAQISA